MIKLNMDREWNFKLITSFSQWWNKPQNTLIDIPHDFSIIQERDPNTLAGDGNGFFPGGIGEYEKTIFIPEDWKDKIVLLEFEGIYMNSSVKINHNLVSHQPYGYTSFHCDITPFLKYGENNLIHVLVNNSALPNTRWYSGSGIYRHVNIQILNKTHFLPWGIFVTTPNVSEDLSTVLVKTRIKNLHEEPQEVTLKSSIHDLSGNCVAVNENNINIKNNQDFEFEQFLTVLSTNLWSPESPYLYTLKSELLHNGIVIDYSCTNFGIRSITFDAKNGFRLNGKSVKLKGGCVHHDCGLLGAASYDRAEYRKVKLMKSNGFNAIRCAHNPPSPAFLDACDRLGLLVIDEVFDGWRQVKTPNDYGNFFEDWWQRDLSSIILRDRNHPSIIMWSIGNETYERDGRSEGYQYSIMLSNFVRSLDSTRAVTNALQNITEDPTLTGLEANASTSSKDYDYWGELSFDYVKPLDVVGYNYLLERYKSDLDKFPDRVICGTESFPKDIFDYWSAVEDLPNVIGDFVWTSIDYMGEAGLGHVRYNGENGYLGGYPWHQAFCGDLDICGFKRPQSYYRDCVWGILKAPYIAVYKPQHYGEKAYLSLWGWTDVISSWSWDGFEDKPIVIDIYCISSEVELILNGRSLGKKSSGKANRFISTFETIYQPGELISVAYEDNVEVSRSLLRTSGNPTKLLLTPDKIELDASFGDLSFITVEIYDDNNNLVTNSIANVSFSVSGVGNLIAVGNGNPISEEMYIGNHRRLHEGRAMCVVRSNGEVGDIIVSAASEGVEPSVIKLKTK